MSTPGLKIVFRIKHAHRNTRSQIIKECSRRSGLSSPPYRSFSSSVATNKKRNTVVCVFFSTEGAVPLVNHTISKPLYIRFGLMRKEHLHSIQMRRRWQTQGEAERAGVSHVTRRSRKSAAPLVRPPLLSVSAFPAETVGANTPARFSRTFHVRPPRLRTTTAHLLLLLSCPQKEQTHGHGGRTRDGSSSQTASQTLPLQIAMAESVSLRIRDWGGGYHPK